MLRHHLRRRCVPLTSIVRRHGDVGWVLPIALSRATARVGRPSARPANQSLFAHRLGARVRSTLVALAYRLSPTIGHQDSRSSSYALVCERLSAHNSASWHRGTFARRGSRVVPQRRHRRLVRCGRGPGTSDQPEFAGLPQVHLRSSQVHRPPVAFANVVLWLLSTHYSSTQCSAAACQERRLTLPSSGHTTAGGDCSLRHHRRRRCVPLTSNVRALSGNADRLVQSLTVESSVRCHRSTSGSGCPSFGGQRTDCCSRPRCPPPSACATHVVTQRSVLRGQRAKYIRGSFSRQAFGEARPQRRMRHTGVSSHASVARHVCLHCNGNARSCDYPRRRPSSTSCFRVAGWQEIGGVLQSAP